MKKKKEMATKEDIDGLARMIKKGFDENTEHHQQIFKLLDNHTERLERIREN